MRVEDTVMGIEEIKDLVPLIGITSESECLKLAEVSFKAGMRKVVEHIKQENLFIHPDTLRDWGL